MSNGLDGWGGGEFCKSEVEEFQVEASAGKPGEHEVSGFDVAVEEMDLVGGKALRFTSMHLFQSLDRKRILKLEIYQERHRSQSFQKAQLEGRD